MHDLLTALCLILAIEGLCLAAFPRGTIQALSELSKCSDEVLRWSGIGLAIAGVVLLGVVRHVWPLLF